MRRRRPQVARRWRSRAFVSLRAEARSGDLRRPVLHPKPGAHSRLSPPKNQMLAGDTDALRMRRFYVRPAFRRTALGQRSGLLIRAMDAEAAWSSALGQYRPASGFGRKLAERLVIGQIMLDRDIV
jgi:hypothetical protein